LFAAGVLAVFCRPSAKQPGPAQLARARVFFEKYGARTVLLARFIPVMRTLAPVMAGASGMNKRAFTKYNVVGGVAWGAVVPLLGYLLGGIGFVRAHIELILIGVVVLSMLPLLVSYLNARNRRRTGFAQ
jgi:membrane-associated protein